MCRLRVQLDRRQVVFLRFLLEGYEGLATTSTVDRFASVVELHAPVEQVGELYALLNAEKERLGISRIDEGAL
jgi:hypothetical protein